MSKLSWYSTHQQDIILKLASLDLIDIIFDENGDMCVKCSAMQKKRIEMLADLDDDNFIELFDI